MKPVLFRVFWLPVFFLIFSESVWANDPDSLLFVQQKWETKELKPGVIWKHAHIQNLFNSNQVIHVLEVDLSRHIGNVHFAGDPQKLIKTSDFAQENEALAAINGGFFNMKNGGAVDVLKIDGQIVNAPEKNSPNANGAFVLTDKEAAILKSKDLNVEAYPNIMASGPLLMIQGEELELKKTPFVENRHPRTAVAVTKDNKLLLITIDGRNSRAQGFSLQELTKVLKWSGAVDALNLDGGGSTTFYVEGEGVVNYPSDNKAFDHEGERRVANIIYIK